MTFNDINVKLTEVIQVEYSKELSKLCHLAKNLYNLYKRLVKEKVRVIHSIREHPWGQRALRVYDPDDHIIEFAESMESVVKRLSIEGLELEEISEKSMMPIEFIKMVLKKP